jgi:hypothetical protein
MGNNGGQGRPPVTYHREPPRARSANPPENSPGADRSGARWLIGRVGEPSLRGVTHQGCKDCGLQMPDSRFQSSHGRPRERQKPGTNRSFPATALPWAGKDHLAGSRDVIPGRFPRPGGQIGRRYSGQVSRGVAASPGDVTRGRIRRRAGETGRHSGQVSTLRRAGSGVSPGRKGTSWRAGAGVGPGRMRRWSGQGATLPGAGCDVTVDRKRRSSGQDRGAGDPGSDVSLGRSFFPQVLDAGQHQVV